MRAWVAGACPELRGPLYVSVDMDGLDPAFAPGVSHREPGGLTVREVVTMIQSLPGPIVGADVVELNPTQDGFRRVGDGCREARARAREPDARNARAAERRRATVSRALPTHPAEATTMSVALIAPAFPRSRACTRHLCRA